MHLYLPTLRHNFYENCKKYKISIKQIAKMQCTGMHVTHYAPCLSSMQIAEFKRDDPNKFL